MSPTGKILIVDDEPQMRLAMTRVLTRAGYAVDEARDGLEALDKLRGAAYPVVVTDVRMPGLDGVAFLGRARELSPATEVLMITAYGTVQSAVEAVRRGARDYILKPFPPEVLERAVGEAIGAREDRAAAAPPGSASKRILTRDPKMERLLDRARRAAESDATILIQAESGAGKELLARFLHEASPRRDGPFVAVNCAAFPRELLESELFGHARGAFTGAVRERRGHFEAAHSGTLLLDEIGEMSAALQAKLLRVLQEREVQRLGEEAPRRVDVRVVASTNLDLAAAVRGGGFREDLYFRLSVIPLRIPPLRERPEDVPLLLEHFCRVYAGKRGPLAVSPSAMDRLCAHSWPGNVRELENVVQRAVVLASGEELDVADFFPEEASSPAGREGRAGPLHGWRGGTLDQAERFLIEEALVRTGGNRTRAASLVGISVRTLRNKLRGYKVADGKNLPTGS